jgi:hypothetical protein
MLSVMRSLTRSLLPGLLASVLAPGALGAQGAPTEARNGRTIAPDQATIRVYHGSDDQTQILRRAPFSQADEFAEGVEIVRPKSSKVCVAVVNAHPLFYDYSLSAKVDSTRAVPELPFVRLVTEFIVSSGMTVMRLDPADPIPVPADRPTTDNWLPWVLVRLDSVQTADSIAAAIVAQSEMPEPPTGVLQGDGFGEARGLREAKRMLSAAPGDRFAFNDPNLKANVATAVKDALEVAQRQLDLITGTTPADLARREHIRGVIRLLPGYADRVVAAHEQLRNSITGTATTVTDCRDVGEFPMTLSLKIAKRKGARGVRDVGDLLVPVRVVPSQARPQVEMALSAVMTFVPDVPTFGVRNGVVTQDARDAFRVRPATFVLLNVGSLGADDAYSLGVGFGAAFVSDDRKVISDVVPFSLHVGFRDVIRLGLGVGISRQPGDLKGGARVGEPLPGDVKNINDVIDYRNRLGWFALVTLPGFTLKK